MKHDPKPDEAPAAYETFQKKADGMVKVVLKP
jgi:threonine dehydrogenase-like Zn-dependent dehydrogenase